MTAKKRGRWDGIGLACACACAGILLAGPVFGGETGAPAASVSPPGALELKFGAFVDTSYLYDFNRPGTLDRLLPGGNGLATTGERANEFNVNLAFVEAQVHGDRVRGRLALQAGTSVQANYRGESAGLGLIQGSLPAELLQEAVIGYRIADGLWMDAGIFFAHLGFENFISRDNWTYTRSLIAEFSPYYETGARLSWQVSPLWAVQLLLLNGWQDIAETNTAKSLGWQIGYAPSPRFGLTYNGYFGNEPGGLARVFNELIGRVSLDDAWQVALSVDEGSQARGGGASGASFWYGTALLARWQATRAVAFGARLERYADRDGVVAPIGMVGAGLRANGASLNVDTQLHPQLKWRNELRVLHADDDAVFAGNDGLSKTDSFAVSSLALTF